MSNRQVKPSDLQLSQLEKRLEQIQAQVRDLLRENHKMKMDLKFFELMLLEEYQLLIQLIGKEQNKLYIQSVCDKQKLDK